MLVGSSLVTQTQNFLAGDVDVCRWFYSFYLELKTSFSNLGVGAERSRPRVFERVECVGLTALVLSVSHMPPLSAGFPLPSPSPSPATHQAGQTEQQQQPTNLGIINI